MRRFLKLRGWKAHDIRERIAPPGVISGEQWVRERFPGELDAVRGRGRHTVLVVGTDADTMSVNARTASASLDQACQTQGVAKRTGQDPVVMVVPKRNIETWFAYLRGENTNEVDRYPRYDKESDCQAIVRELDERCRSQQRLHAPLPDSLRRTCLAFKSVDWGAQGG